MRRIAVALLALCCVGCPAPERPAAPPGRAVDKHSMYGDASLVPTREGERVRRELALAGELRHALEQLGLTGVHVDVELHDPPGVIVVAQTTPDADRADLEAVIVDFARVLVPDAGVHVRLRTTQDASEHPAPSPAGGPRWAIVFACIGLGLSVGVTLERLSARRMGARVR